MRLGDQLESGCSSSRKSWMGINTVGKGRERTGWGGEGTQK